MNNTLSTCPQCGKRFKPWRAKQFCSEPCKRRAQNERAKAKKGPAATWVADDPNPEKLRQENQASPRTFSTYGPTAWTACNEATLKLTREGSSNAVGWAILCEVTPGRDAWFGRIGDDFSFGPTTKPRAKAAVEARLLGGPFEKVDGERSWSGTCWKMLGGSVPARPPLPAVGDPWLLAPAAFAEAA
jgi:hypothetical protein